MNNPHIHTPDDGRGVRDVFVDGKILDRCFFADTKKGVARAYRYPYKLHKHKKRALTKTYHGKITIKNRVENA